MDRVEQDADGRAYVVDFKTGKQSPTKDEVAAHPSSPCTSWPSGKAPSTTSSTAAAPTRAAPNSYSCASPHPEGGR
ncbi:PD-(D/E)XK nuclease family protein [Streptomyces sp. M10(2022)]